MALDALDYLEQALVQDTFDEFKSRMITFINGIQTRSGLLMLRDRLRLAPEAIRRDADVIAATQAAIVRAG